MGPGTIVDVPPADGDEGFPHPIPVTSPSDDLDSTVGASIPGHRESSEPWLDSNLFVMLPFRVRLTPWQPTV
jgi:hypothetical protein